MRLFSRTAADATGCRALRIHALQRCTAGCVFLLCMVTVFAFVTPLAKTLSPLFIFKGCTSQSYSALQLLKIIGYTFAESLCSTLVAVAIGIPAAYYISHKRFFGRRLLEAFSVVPLCVPALIVALGYISTFGMSGFINRFLMLVLRRQEPVLTFLYSFTGLVLAQGFYNFPIVMASVASVWRNLNTEQEDSARLLGASERKVFFDVTLVQLLNSVISGAIVVFVYCFFSFMMVLLLGSTGGTTLEVAIYHAGRSVLNFRSAALLAVVETSCAFAALLGISIFENRGIKQKGVSFEGERSSCAALTRKDAVPLIVLLLFVFVFFVFPLLSIVLGSFTVRTGGNKAFSLSVWAKVLTTKSFFTALKNTFGTALAMSVLCTAVALFYAVFLRLSRFRENSFFRTLPLFPLSVSSVVMGLGMSMLVRRGNPLLLVLAETALSWPLAFRQLYPHLARIPDNTLDAAFSLAPSRTDAVFRVVLPYCRNGILSSLGFCFATSAGDATLPLVLSVHKFDTLALYTYRLAGSYRFAQACVSGIVLGAVCMISFLLSKRLKTGGTDNGIS